MNKRGYDVRVVANYTLKEASAVGVKMTNLHLNKSLFFMHVDFLREHGLPLVSAKIEAWEYGPVFREIYNQFKPYGREPIRSFAKRVDFDSGEKVDAWDELPSTDLQHIQELALFYARIPAGLLVDLSHATGGAWDCVWNESGDINAGMEITEEIIRACELPKGQRIKMQ
jgi:uncharacterized phage-associated protein